MEKLNTALKKLRLFLKKNNGFLYRAAISVCICVFIFSMYKIVTRVYGYYHDNKQYKQIREQIGTVDPQEKFRQAFEELETASDNQQTSLPLCEDNESETEHTSNESVVTQPPYITVFGDPDELNERGIIKEYAVLVDQNSDMAGWIFIPGYKKEISYPVMQAEDNEYYLDKEFDRDASYAGSIFMDFRNRTDEPDRNIIIYGHAMNDMAMFGNLKKFPDKPEDYLENTTVYLDLLDTHLEYEIFSTYYCDASDNYRQVDFYDDNEYMDYLESIISNSVHDYMVELTPNDRIITLSTCNNSLGKNIRTVIHARLVRCITYDETSAYEGRQEIEDSHMSSIPKDVVTANVYLLGITLTYGAPENHVNAKLDPPFHTALKEFTTTLPAEWGCASLTVEPADSEAHIEITLNNETANLDNLDLKYGENIIKMKITSSDWQYARTLTLNVCVDEPE